MFKIESGIEVPKTERQSKYPFDAMEVGHSFFVECDNPDVRRPSVMTSAKSWAKKAGVERRFVARTVDGGLRCWRTA